MGGDTWCLKTGSWWLSSTWLSNRVACNTPLWPLLMLTGSWIGLIQSNSWLCQTLALVCFVPTISFNLHLWPVSTQPIVSKKCLKVVTVGQLCWELKTLITVSIVVLCNWVLNASNWQGLEILISSILVVYPCFNQGKWASLLGSFSTQLDSVVGGGSQDQQKNQNH